MDEFDQLCESGDYYGALDWVGECFPYPSIEHFFYVAYVEANTGNDERAVLFLDHLIQSSDDEILLSIVHGFKSEIHLSRNVTTE